MRRVTPLVAILLALVGCSTTNTNEGGYVSGNGVITVVDRADRKTAPKIAGTDLEGRPVALDDFAGKTVVINIWGSWCPPCRQEAPDLAAASRELEDDDVQFLGIAIRDQRSSALAFERRNEITYPSIDDPSARTLLGFAKTLPAVAVPTTYVIDADGKVAARALDKVSKNTLIGLVDEVQRSMS